MENVKIFTTLQHLDVHLHKDFYESEAIRAASFKFSAKCFVFIKPFDASETLVRFEPKLDQDVNLDIIAKEFCNEVLDQQIRVDLEKKYNKIRELIVSQAFAPVDKLNIEH